MAYRGRRVLAVVPARSGSKGVAHKNLLKLGGRSLIAIAGDTLTELPWIDARIISTDSAEYADEAQRHGLDAPFLRPDELSTDTAGAVETMQHAVREMETRDGGRFDVVLIIEPTSPLRRAEDITAAVDLLVDNADAASVVTVTAIDPKFHPLKVFRIENDRLTYFDRGGGRVVARQQLEPLYTRNGVCYALTRACLMDDGEIIGGRTRPLVIDRPLVNIDGVLDVAVAEVLLAGTDQS